MDKNWQQPHKAFCSVCTCWSATEEEGSQSGGNRLRVLYFSCSFVISHAVIRWMNGLNDTIITRFSIQPESPPACVVQTGMVGTHYRWSHCAAGTSQNREVQWVTATPEHKSTGGFRGHNKSDSRLSLFYQSLGQIYWNWIKLNFTLYSDKQYEATMRQDSRSRLWGILAQHRIDFLYEKKKKIGFITINALEQKQAWDFFWEEKLDVAVYELNKFKVF